MPTITDWLMVSITAVYVIATVFICGANIRSAKATRDQLAESKRQFEETKRLELLPYIQFETSTDLHHSHNLTLVLCDKDCNGGDYISSFNVENIGRGTAKDITYTYEWDNCLKRYYRGAFPIGGLQPGGNSYLKIVFALPKEFSNPIKCAIELHFEDLLKNKYSQRIEFYFKPSKTTMVMDNYTVQSPIVMDKGALTDA